MLVGLIVSYMTYLFDTDAVSETLRKQPSPIFIQWLSIVRTDELFISSVTLAELYKGAFRISNSAKLITRIETDILPTYTIRNFGETTAKIYGELSATLEQQGKVLDHPDLQIAATALEYGLTLITGNIKHFQRIPNLKLNPVLYQAKNPS